MGRYEAVAFVFGVLGVALTVLESVWCWPVGLVNVALLGVVFWSSRLYADAALQVVYVGLCIYGWWAWLHGGAGGGALRISRVPRRALVALLLVGAFGGGLLGLLLRRATDAALPFWDAGTTSFSLVAQWMQARKWLENWMLWIAVDVAYVGIYLAKQLYLTAGLYAIFVALAALGMREWARAAGRPGAAP